MFEPLPKSPIGAMLRRLSPTRYPVCLQPLTSASKRGVYPRHCRNTGIPQTDGEVVVEGRHAAEDSQQYQRHWAMKRWMASLAWS